MVKKIILASVVPAAIVSLANATSLKGRGASFPAPLYKAWTSEYYKATGNKVDYTPTGSGDGIKSIKKRIVDFAGSDKPLKPKYLAKHKLLMFPSVVGSIVLAYNIDGIKDGELKLSRAAIAAIFSGKATNWAAPKVVAGKSNSGVTANIKQIKNSIGYIEYSYKLKENLPAAQIQNKAGKFVKATVSAFQDAAKYAKWSKDSDFYAVIGDPDGETSYPIVAATFILLPAEKVATNKEVVKFFDWAYKNGDKTAEDLGYVPLPASTKDEIRKYWAQKIKN